MASPAQSPKLSASLHSGRLAISASNLIGHFGLCDSHRHPALGPCKIERFSSNYLGPLQVSDFPSAVWTNPVCWASLCVGRCSSIRLKLPNPLALVFDCVLWSLCHNEVMWSIGLPHVLQLLQALLSELLRYKASLPEDCGPADVDRPTAWRIS